MELMGIIQVLLRRWWLVVIPVATAVVFVVPDLLRGGVAGGYSVTIRYSAAQALEAIPGRDGDYQDVWLASELTVNALTDWVRSTSFVDEIAQRSSVSFDRAQLGIAADNRRSVGQLFLSYPDAAALEAIAQAALEVLRTRAHDYFPQLGGQPARVTVLDPVRVTPAPPPAADRLAPLIRLGLALLAGVGLAFLAEYLDPFVRRREQVEALDLAVIASIPRE